MTELQLKLMERADKTESFGCFLMYDENIYVCIGREERCTSRDSDGSPDRFDSWRNTLPLEDYMKGDCFIDRYSWEKYCTSIVELHSYYENRKRTKDYDIIGHPYGWERLTYLQSRTYEDESYYELVYESRNNLFRYVYDRRELMLKPCIERPEKGMLLVLEFLETLPKGNYL